MTGLAQTGARAAAVEQEKERAPSKERIGLDGYIRDFGLDPRELSSDDLVMMMVARHVQHYVDDLRIPMSHKVIPSDQTIVVEKEVEKLIERTRYIDGEERSETPADRMDLSQVTAPEDLRDLLPGEWLTEEAAPDLFLKKLVGNDLMRVEWREAVKNPVSSHETIKVKEYVEQPAPPTIMQQHAYCLRDISGSMRDEDGRGIVAGGLSLAYLRSGYLKRARMTFRPFDYEPGTTSFAVDQKELAAVARSALCAGGSGGTDIQRALAASVGDIKAGGNLTRADILLISDGLSQLTRSPLGDVKLHSFVLGDPLKSYRYDDELSWAKTQLKALRSWSKSFTEISADDFAEILVPTRQDLEELRAETESIGRDIERVVSEESLEEIVERKRRASAVVEAYQDAIRTDSYRRGDDPHREKKERADEIERRLAELGKLLQSGFGEELFRANEARMRAEEEARQAARSEAVDGLAESLAKLRDEMMSGGGAGGGERSPLREPEPPEERRESLWDWLWRNVSSLWRRDQPAASGARSPMRSERAM